MKKLTPLVLVAVGALALAGCSTASDDPTDVGEAPQGSAETTESAAPEESDVDDDGFDERDVRSEQLDIDHERAIEIAVEAAGGGFVFSIELDHSRSHGEWIYEIDVLEGTTEHDIDISATTGDVLDHDRDSDDDREQEITFDMTPEEALELAGAELSSDAVIEGWTLSWDDGSLEYEIDVEPGDDLIVDVETGDVRED